MQKDDAEWLHNSTVKTQMKANGPVVQREVFGLPIFQRLPTVPRRGRRFRRKQHHPHGAAALPSLTTPKRQGVLLLPASERQFSGVVSNGHSDGLWRYLFACEYVTG